MKKEILKGKFKSVQKSADKVNDKVFTPRPWQTEAFDVFFEQGNITSFIMNTPTGAGKSKTMCLISSKILDDDSSKKVIIAVPQKNIGNGFLKPEFDYIVNGKQIPWNVSKSNNLCEEGSEKSKTIALKNFIINNDSESRVMICTHSTLTNVIKGEIELNNLYVWIDEAHHVQTHEELAQLNNRLGGVVKKVLSSDNCNIGLVTATLFRGDSMNIIPKEYADDFKTYSLPYDKHFENNCEYLKSFVYDFHLGGDNWTSEVTDCVDEGDKTIVFIPTTNSSNLRNYTDKHYVIDSIIKNLSDDDKIKELSTGVTQIKRNGKKFNIINLVDDKESKVRDMRVKYIGDKETKDKVDMIISMNMFTEGSDWDIANKVVIVGARDSLTLQMQMIGRVFRDHISKNNKPVSIIQLIPNVDANSVGDKVRDNINDYMKCVYSSFIFEMIVNPVEITIKTNNKKGESEPRTKTTPITSMFKEDTEAFEFLKEVITELTDKKIELDSNESSIVDKIVAYNEIIYSVADGYNILCDKEELIKTVMTTFNKRSRGLNKLKSDEVSHIDFDCIDEIDPMDFIKSYSTDVCGVDNLRSFRDAMLGNNDQRWNEIRNSLFEYMNQGNEFPRGTNKQFGSWINNQKTSYNKELLSEHRIKLLEQIPKWIWSEFDEKWNEKRNSLFEYMDQGNEFPSQSNKQFGSWINNQKCNYRNGILSEDKIKSLEYIKGWVWSADEKWNEMRDSLLEYMNHGNEFPSQTNKQFGKWITSQRSNFKNGLLSEDRIKLLEQIPGWVWSLDEKWNEIRNSLLEYMNKGKEFPISQDKQFCNWISTQRTCYRKGMLSEERIKLLEQIPNWVWIVDLYEKWKEIRNSLFEYINQGKEFPISQDKQFGKWITSQRSNFKNGLLSEDKIKSLEQIPGWVWSKR